MAQIEGPSAASPTLTDIVSLADQVEAGVVDVMAAWGGFLVSEGPQGASDKTQPAAPDKIYRSADSLRYSVSRLRTLADEIRARA